jgi:site-specific recombinase XerD
MPRRGERAPKVIPGDRSDPLGFPALVEEFLESMAVRGYSEKTIENRRYNLTYLVLWLAERGVSRPGEVTKPMLDRYQRAVFHHRKPDGQPLSFRSQVQRLTPIRAGVGKPGACHLFRHTMATLMLEGGADIRFIQQMLGHADISTTQTYTQVSLRQLRAIHTATHPAASNIPRRQRPAASDGQIRPAAAFETEVLHLTLATEVRQENAQLDAAAIDIADDHATPPVSNA